jgi:hypothetical protein
MATRTATYHVADALDRATDRGTCPACARAIRLTSKGFMKRHGWKEQGRRKGQFGAGYQWGACNGTGQSPIEITDADAEFHAARMLEQADRVAMHAMHVEADGLERIEHCPHVDIWTKYVRQGKDAADAQFVQIKDVQTAVAAGVTFTSEVVPGEYYGSGWRRGAPRYRVMASVPRGYEPPRYAPGCSVKSYADLRDLEALELRQMEEALRKNAEYIRTLCATTREEYRKDQETVLAYITQEDAAPGSCFRTSVNTLALGLLALGFLNTYDEGLRRAYAAAEALVAAGKLTKSGDLYGLAPAPSQPTPKAEAHQPSLFARPGAIGAQTRLF